MDADLSDDSFNTGGDDAWYVEVILEASIKTTYLVRGATEAEALENAKRSKILEEINPRILDESVVEVLSKTLRRF